MDFRSDVKVLGAVGAFPAFLGERVYMRPFLMKDGLPDDLRRWDDVVNSMLVGVETDDPIYIMIDQAFVPAGDYHRRPGLHIDGYWSPGESGGRRGHWWVKSCHGSHRPIHVPSGPIHSPNYPTHSPGGIHAGWSEATFEEKEAIILASDVTASRAVSGTFRGPIGDGGDCSDVTLLDVESIPMEAGKVYQGNVTMLHETLPCKYDSYRSVVRLNVPNWHPTVH